MEGSEDYKRMDGRQVGETAFGMSGGWASREDIMTGGWTGGSAYGLAFRMADRREGWLACAKADRQMSVGRAGSRAGRQAWKQEVMLTKHTDSAGWSATILMGGSKGGLAGQHKRDTSRRTIWMDTMTEGRVIPYT